MRCRQCVWSSILPLLCKLLVKSQHPATEKVVNIFSGPSGFRTARTSSCTRSRAPTAFLRVLTRPHLDGHLKKVEKVSRNELEAFKCQMLFIHFGA